MTIRGDRKKGTAALVRSFLFFSLITIILSSCASTGKTNSGMTEVMTVDHELSVHLYNDIEKMRAAYMYQGGDIRKAKRLKGFYAEKSNTIHCMKWDFHTCGHELYHALQYKASPALLADDDREHFKGRHYTNTRE
jgi:hypothetical protein